VYFTSLESKRYSTARMRASTSASGMKFIVTANLDLDKHKNWWKLN